MSCVVLSLRCSSAPVWLWRRLAAVALIPPLAWEPPYAMDVALKSKKTKQNKTKQKKPKTQQKTQNHKLGLRQHLMLQSTNPLQKPKIELESVSSRLALHVYCVGVCVRAHVRQRDRYTERGKDSTHANVPTWTCTKGGMPLKQLHCRMIRIALCFSK